MKNRDTQLHTAHPTSISTLDLDELLKSKKALTIVPLAMRALNTVGTPIEKGVAILPKRLQDNLNSTIQKALQLSVKANLKTLQTGKISSTASNRMYKVLSVGTGFTGGFFGIAGFTADLLISTKFLMRSILDIARSQGEDITDPEVQLQCLQVFALGGSSQADDALDSSYYATRVALDQALSKIATDMATQGAKKFLQAIAAGTPGPIGSFLSKIISQYSIQVLDKFAAQAIPVAGAASGAALNLIFITHFQRIARAHFTVKRLEKKYGEKEIRDLYETIDLG